MQIIIDIPKNIIEGAKSSPNYYPTYHFEKIWKAIVNGTPLPKGHGDLIDRNEVCRLEEELCVTECGCCGLDGCFYDRAKTIIEADKAESEG